MNKINVFTLPFAGGSEYSFFEFKKQSPPELEIIPVSLPGRGKRIAENKLESLSELRDDIYETIKDQLDEPYVIYGHSMGAMLTALVTEKIQQNNLRQPLALFVSGCMSPVRKTELLYRHSLPDAEFIKMLDEMGGSPKEILENVTLLEFFLPILRTDFKAVDLFKYEHIDQLNSPIHVMIGTEEDATLEGAEAWGELASTVTVREFSGDHFFIYEHLLEILEIIKENSVHQFDLMNKF